MRSPGSASVCSRTLHRLLLGEVAGQGPVERGAVLAADDPEPGQPGGAGPLGLLGQLVEARAREVGAVGDHDRLDGRRREGLAPRCRSNTVGQVDQLHAEAQVGLVGAEAVAGVGPRHALDRRRPLPRGRLGGIEHGLGDEGHDVVLGGEGALHVELHELELAVGPQVLVAQAAGDLEVAVEAAHHEELLGQLRALRQRVERAVVQAGRARRTPGSPRGSAPTAAASRSRRSPGGPWRPGWRR